MKRRLAKLTLIAGSALLAPLASAQSSTGADNARANKTPAAAPKTLTAATTVKAGSAVVVTTVTAAGSVIVLADGIVANATMAQIQPPASGFVYER